MRIKTYYAKTMTEAMQMVREAMGEDAIIVATREEQGGRRVRVTAAIDDALEQQDLGDKAIHFEFGRYLKQAKTSPINRDEELRAARTQNAPSPQKNDWLAYDDEEEDGGVAEFLSEVLLKHSVSNEVIDTIVTAAMLVGGEDPRNVLTRSLGELFTFRKDLGSKNPIMLVGAPGAGKTLAAAKLAARWSLDGKKIAVITTDTVRAGAIEQLQAFTRILSTPLLTVRSRSELIASVNTAKDQGVDHIIIDTGGGNPFEPTDMKEIAKYLTAMPVDPILVMPAGLDADESAEIARVYSILGVDTIMPSRLDIARRMGGILSAAHKGGMGFAAASSSSGVADGIEDLTASSLAHYLLPKSINKQKTTT